MFLKRSTKESCIFLPLAVVPHVGISSQISSISRGWTQHRRSFSSSTAEPEEESSSFASTADRMKAYEKAFSVALDPVK